MNKIKTNYTLKQKLKKKRYRDKKQTNKGRKGKSLN